MNNPNNQWVQVFSVHSDDSWIERNLPTTPLVIVSEVNGAKFYVFRNSEPLPAVGYWYIAEGKCFATTDFLDPFDVNVSNVPAFPIHSSNMLIGEPEYVGVYSG